MQTRCLEILSASLKYMEDPWKEIGLETMSAILKGSNPAEIIPVLAILKDLIQRVEIREWKPLWPRLVWLSRHENPACRRSVHQVFQKAFDLIDHRDPDFAAAILCACTDVNEQLANDMQNFLAQKLPSDSTMDRLLTYLSDFYSPATEDIFIPFLTHFLLERTTYSQQYSEPLFAKPLDDIPFELVDFSTLNSQSPSRSWNSSGRVSTRRQFQVKEMFSSIRCNPIGFLVPFPIHLKHF